MSDRFGADPSAADDFLRAPDPMRNDRPSSAAARRPGFTLIELLVVIGIIALIGSILLVTMSRARKSGDKFRLGAQLQMIEQGLEAYRTDFNALPVTSPDNKASTVTADDVINEEGLRGARLLCKALMGQGGGVKPPPAAGANYVLTNAHQDGKSGLGFAVVGRSGTAVTADADGNLRGKSFGPYLAEDRFPISNTDASGKPVTSSLVPEEKYDDSAVLLDANGSPILYYPVLNAQALPAVTDAVVSLGAKETGTSSYAGTPMLRSSDNEVWLLPIVLRKELGLGPDARYGTPSNDAQKILDPRTPTPAQLTESRVAGVADRARRVPNYLLWTAGPDGIFGPNMNATGKQLGELDDVTSLPAQ